MFVWAPVPEGYASAAEFAGAMIDRAGVIAVPGTAFGSLGEGYVRFALVRPAEELREIAEILRDSGVLSKK